MDENYSQKQQRSIQNEINEHLKATRESQKTAKWPSVVGKKTSVCAGRPSFYGKPKSICGKDTFTGVKPISFSGKWQKGGNHSNLNNVIGYIQGKKKFNKKNHLSGIHSQEIWRDRLNVRNPKVSNVQSMNHATQSCIRPLRGCIHDLDIIAINIWILRIQKTSVYS